MLKAVPWEQAPLRSQGDRPWDEVINDDPVGKVRNESDALTRTYNFPQGGSKDSVKLHADDCALTAGIPLPSQADCS